MIVIEVLPKSKDIMTMRLLGGRGVLGDGLGLDLTGRDGGLLVVGSELGGLSCDALEDV